MYACCPLSLRLHISCELSKLHSNWGRPLYICCSCEVRQSPPTRNNPLLCCIRWAGAERTSWRSCGRIPAEWLWSWRRFLRRCDADTRSSSPPHRSGDHSRLPPLTSSLESTQSASQCSRMKCWNVLFAYFLPETHSSLLLSAKPYCSCSNPAGSQNVITNHRLYQTCPISDKRFWLTTQSRKEGNLSEREWAKHICQCK